MIFLSLLSNSLQRTHCLNPSWSFKANAPQFLSYLKHSERLALAWHIKSCSVLDEHVCIQKAPEVKACNIYNAEQRVPAHSSHFYAPRIQVIYNAAVRLQLKCQKWLYKTQVTYSASTYFYLTAPPRETKSIWFISKPDHHIILFLLCYKHGTL